MELAMDGRTSRHSHALTANADLDLDFEFDLNIRLAAFLPWLCWVRQTTVRLSRMDARLARALMRVECWLSAWSGRCPVSASGRRAARPELSGRGDSW